MPFFRLGTFTSTRKVFVACAATLTDALPSNAPPVPRRIARRLTIDVFALSRSLVTTPVSVPALAPAGSELIDVTFDARRVRGRCQREHGKRR